MMNLPELFNVLKVTYNLKKRYFPFTIMDRKLITLLICSIVNLLWIPERFPGQCTVYQWNLITQPEGDDNSLSDRIHASRTKVIEIKPGRGNLLTFNKTLENRPQTKLCLLLVIKQSINKFSLKTEPRILRMKC